MQNVADVLGDRDLLDLLLLLVPAKETAAMMSGLLLVR